MQILNNALPAVLITGGTSGLGLELVRVFVENGWNVVATGRQPGKTEEFKERFILFITDFSNLKGTAETVKEICRNHTFDLVINNAGVLSPPHPVITDDDLEYTYQVNFLAHLLLNEMIIRGNAGRGLTTAVITSPVYRVADPDLSLSLSCNKYTPFRAYSGSKLLLALMCSYLTRVYYGKDIKFFGYDPGIFSSGIYRMQKKWFRVMYQAGALFMKKPRKVALNLLNLIESDDLVSGSVYDISGRIRPVPEIESKVYNEFWKECYDRIGQFIH